MASLSFTDRPNCLAANTTSAILLSSAILSLFDLSYVANFCYSRSVRIFIYFLCTNCIKIFSHQRIVSSSLQCYIPFFLNKRFIVLWSIYALVLMRVDPLEICIKTIASNKKRFSYTIQFLSISVR